MLEIVSWWVGQERARGRGGRTSVVVMLLFCIDEVCMMTWSGSRAEIRVNGRVMGRVMGRGRGKGRGGLCMRTSRRESGLVTTT